jgi:hypothetical protein
VFQWKVVDSKININSWLHNPDYPDHILEEWYDVEEDWVAVIDDLKTSAKTVLQF